MKLIGEVLQSKRERLGMTLSELEKRTQIRRETLRAIEHNQFELLSHQRYVIGFIRKYAKAVNIESTQLIEKHQQELPKIDHTMADVSHQVMTNQIDLSQQQPDKETKQLAFVMGGAFVITAVLWVLLTLML
ncbi:RodZ family helix-turn-helix domain-containing protein [Staphylococcus sp. 17KM0847]|uniref:helix-turn-helix domain-containing protein n=1 Tax=Staphylococcus sp. 17KM0847 TaxID=2583989 RepID=UPI0015DC9DAD|nr:helix-turn-helix domain-containing protein [Staphylococcus sp. 17KM0847]QLK85897.1 transcriptional regulator [Staphylococcus sp. 17KM0847]